jgi:glycosyltransferase A (GT-A) superfamily protein (DUF2064 family)
VTGPDTTLLIIAKQPLPGRVKTRLVPPCTHEQASALAEAALTMDWHGADAVFGPAADGGFWALGLRVPDPALLRGVPMSTPATGAIQRARLLAAGLRVADLPRLRDVDTAADAVAVARQAPRSRFAARARDLAMVLSPADPGEGVIGEDITRDIPLGETA